MNILQILPELESGGVERGTIDLAEQLIKNGHKAVVISGGGRLLEQLKKTGAKHYTLPVYKKSLLSVILCSIKLRKIINKEDIDIIHARSRVPAWIGYLAARRSKAVFITTCHGYYSKHFLSRVMGFGKRVITISEIISRHMIYNFGVPREKIRLIYRGVDLKEFQFSSKTRSSGNKEKIIAIIGRISPIKGHAHFIKSLPGILSEFPRARAWIIGEAPAHRKQYLKDLKKLVKKLNLSNSVEFKGNMGNIAQVLKKVDLLVMATTTQEAFGRVIIEAGAVGVPVVAAKVGGITEIVEHEKEGLLVEPSNPHAIAQAALRLLSSRKLADLCVENLRKKVEKEFSLNVLVKKTIKVYEEALQRKKILVLKFGAFGDVILIGPSLRALKNRFPYSEISVVIKNEFKDVLQLCPYIDDLVILKNSSIIEIIKKIFILRKSTYDISVDLQNNNISHFLAFAAGIKDRFGYANKKAGFLLNRGIRDSLKKADPIAHQFYMLKNTLGIDKDADKKLSMWIGEHDKEAIDKFLKANWCSQDQILVGINPLASERWMTKVWLLENYATVCDMLAKKFNARIIFTGTESARDMIDKIIKQTQCKPINAAGATSLMQLGALIQKFSLLVTVDSAPMHIAAALQVPFLALFGPTDPRRHLPEAEKFALIKKELSCSPCYSRRCFRKNCMREITVDEVYKAAVKLMNKK